MTPELREKLRRKWTDKDGNLPEQLRWILDEECPACGGHKPEGRRCANCDFRYSSSKWLGGGDK